MYGGETLRMLSQSMALKNACERKSSIPLRPSRSLALHISLCVVCVCVVCVCVGWCGWGVYVWCGVCVCVGGVVCVCVCVCAYR